MKFEALLLALLPAALAATTSQSAKYASKYAGTKVVRVPTGSSAEDLSRLEGLVQELGVESWTHSYRVNSHVDLQIPADKYERFSKELHAHVNSTTASRFGFSLEVMHEDLGSSILAEAEGMQNPVRTAAAGLANPAWWNSYHSYADHLTFLNDLAALYPNNAQVFTAGKSVEGRDITGIRIYGKSGPGVKPAVIWHGNVHAREWITGVTVEYFAYQLLNNYANSTDIKTLLDDRYEFYVLPVVNPDGFVYSQTSDRMWRKNRSKAPSGSSCVGIDLNRNWDIAWSDKDGASTSPCAEDYKGKAASDTAEITNLQKLDNTLFKSKQGVAQFVDFHSYSQMFFIPYGYTCDKVSPDNTELSALAKGFSTTLQAVHGTRYEYGPSCTTIYKTTGSSDDYAYVQVGIKYSFSAELRDTGNNGFVLPANQIRPTSEETWAGLLYVLKNQK